jgi:hypothetical protein
MNWFSFVLLSIALLLDINKLSKAGIAKSGIIAGSCREDPDMVVRCHLFGLGLCFHADVDLLQICE